MLSVAFTPPLKFLSYFILPSRVTRYILFYVLFYVLFFTYFSTFFLTRILPYRCNSFKYKIKNKEKRLPQGDSLLLFLAFAVECCPLGILATAGVASAYAHLIRRTFTGVVVAAGFCVTGNLSRFAWNAVRIAGAVVFALPEALAAGLIHYLRISAAYMDIVLAAGIILIVGTVYNRTV